MFTRLTFASLLVIGGICMTLNAKPRAQSETPDMKQRQDFFTYLKFIILSNGQTFGSVAPRDPQQQIGTYDQTLRVEYTTLSGKVFKVSADRPVNGHSTAVIPTDESGNGFRVFDQDGNLLGQRFFSPETPLEFKVEERPNRHLGAIVPNVFAQGVSSRTYVRWSWDGGNTWEWHVGPLEMELKGQEAELPKEGLAKNPHPLIEVIVPSGLTFHRKRFVYKGEQP